MNRNRNNGGFTLIEMLCALLILVLLVIGMGTGMDAGLRIYRDATFEAESATLQGIVNTSLDDILRYSINVREVTPAEKLEHGSDTGIPDAADSSKSYVFTSIDYGIQDAYFYIPPHASGGNKGPVRMKNLRNAKEVDLVNTGAYPDLVVSDFAISFSPRVAPGIQGGYFEISYTIASENDSSKTRSVQMIVRLMND